MPKDLERCILGWISSSSPMESFIQTSFSIWCQWFSRPYQHFARAYVRPELLQRPFELKFYPIVLMVLNKSNFQIDHSNSQLTKDKDSHFEASRSYFFTNVKFLHLQSYSCLPVPEICPFKAKFLTKLHFPINRILGNQKTNWPYWASLASIIAFHDLNVN